MGLLAKAFGTVLAVVLSWGVYKIWNMRARKRIPENNKEAIEKGILTEMVPGGFSFFWGHQPHFPENEHRRLDFLQKCFAKTWDKSQHYWFSFPFFSGVEVHCPRCIKHVMKDNFENYPKGPIFYWQMQDFFGDGIFNVDGEKWLEARKVASHMFTGNRLKNFMCEVFCRTADDLIEKLDEIKTGPYKEIDLFNCFNRLTLEAFIEISFGVELGVIKQYPKENKFMKTFDFVVEHLVHRSTNPLWFVTRALGIGKEGRVSKDIAYIEDWVKKVLTDRKAQGGDLDNMDIVSLFLKKRKEEGREVADKELRDLAINFVIAGRDTTAGTLGWLFYNLDKHPDVLAKVVQEVDEVSEQGGTWFEKCRKMTYLHAVLAETQRLFPVVAGFLKFVKEDDRLPCGINVRKGDTIGCTYWAHGRHPMVWGPDAQCFKPERFLGEHTMTSEFKYPFFNAGRRLCMGKNHAYLQLKITTAKLLQRFKFKVLDTALVTYEAGLTNLLRDGLPVYIESCDEEDSLQVFRTHS